MEIKKFFPRQQEKPLVEVNFGERKKKSNQRHKKKTSKKGKKVRIYWLRLLFFTFFGYSTPPLAGFKFAYFVNENSIRLGCHSLCPRDLNPLCWFEIIFGNHFINKLSNTLIWLSSVEFLNSEVFFLYQSSQFDKNIKCRYLECKFGWKRILFLYSSIIKISQNVKPSSNWDNI